MTYSPEESRATPSDALETARVTFLSGKRLDMGRLAAELGISRATLYRWTGHREQLLGDVILSLAEDLFARGLEETRHLRGVERIMAHFHLNTGRIVRDPALRKFLKNETETALRILTSRGGVVQPGMTRLIAGLFEEEQERGTFEPRIEIPVLAYAIVRVTEGFIYNDAIADIQPEVETAARVVGLMLAQ
jgi:AcrR family transcriptional regulator